MNDIDKIMRQARGMIGTRIRFNGQICTVIEVIDDRRELVVEADASHSAIQTDAYGNARREMRALYFISILNQTADELHPDFLNLVNGIKLCT